MLKKNLTVAVALGAMAATPALAQQPVQQYEPETMEDSVEDIDDANDELEQRDNKGEGTLVEVAVMTEGFDTLETALKQGEMIEKLSEDGPYTVFAPTDAAFAKLPEGVLTTMLANDDEEDLKELLQYHVLEGRFTAADIASVVAQNGGSASFETVNDQMITVADHRGSLMISDASGQHVGILSTDVMASNGVIHAIDTVMMPQPQ